MADRKSGLPVGQGSSYGVGGGIKSVPGFSVPWKPTLREVPAAAIQPGKGEPEDEEDEEEEGNTHRDWERDMDLWETSGEGTGSWRALGRTWPTQGDLGAKPPRFPSSLIPGTGLPHPLLAQCPPRGSSALPGSGLVAPPAAVGEQKAREPRRSCCYSLTGTAAPLSPPVRAPAPAPGCSG